MNPDAVFGVFQKNTGSCAGFTDLAGTSSPPAASLLRHQGHVPSSAFSLLQGLPAAALFQELFLICGRNHLIPAASASMMPPIRLPAACGHGAANAACPEERKNAFPAPGPRARTERCSGACRPCTPAGPCRTRKGRHNATRPYSSAFPARGKARNLLRRGGKRRFPRPLSMTTRTSEDRT